MVFVSYSVHVVKSSSSTATRNEALRYLSLMYDEHSRYEYARMKGLPLPKFMYCKGQSKTKINKAPQKYL